MSRSVPAPWLNKPPLYRRENTTAFRSRHYRLGGDHSADRHSKAEQRSEDSRRPMHGKRQLGLDYTPLYRFLLSKVGQPWNAVHAEAVARLDKPDPIFRLVARHPGEHNDYVRIGESSFYSGLFVDEDGLLRPVNPAIGPSSLEPDCRCCTYTFNGLPFTKRFRGSED